MSADYVLSFRGQKLSANDAKRMLGPIPQIQIAFVDLQGYLFR